MHNPLPSEDFILSLSTGDEIVLLGERMEVTREKSTNFLGEEREMMFFSKRRHTGYNGGYPWKHVRALSNGPDHSKWQARMPPNVIARLVAAGDFNIE